jgi:putative SOS response-associated peptidase YedK
LRPVADGALSMYRVSEKLNKPGYDAADLQEEVKDELRLF